MEFKRHRVEKELVVVGGGMPGICAAVQAARHGLSVALINNRGYLGGNASAECFVNIAGATGMQEFNLYARESGLMEELLLENLHRNPQGNRFIWDTVLMDFVLREKPLELFLNTTVDRVDMKGYTVVMASGVQSTTEKRFEFHAPLFLDDTGDGTLGALAGAKFRKGREAKSEYNERLAQDQSDHYVMPSTLNFTAHDTGKPVKYIAPDFALDITKTDILKRRTIPKKSFYFAQWYYEIGGELDQIENNEEIIQKHRELVYGIWDYVKNSGLYDAENFDLDYVSCIPGKRESRRLLGDVILTEQDVVEQRDFEDALGYGGWSIDLHAVGGIFSDELANQHVFLKGIYQIPYRCAYSVNIHNLFMAGRCISTSHVAFGSARVMATLSTLAQGLGTAAYLCRKYDTTPRGVYEHHLEELRCLALRHDQFIVGRRLDDPANLAHEARIAVSSVMPCERGERGECIRLDKTVALTVPVRRRLGRLSLLVRSAEEAVLNYTVWAPRKRENYDPHTRIAKGQVVVPAGRDFAWVDLPIDRDVEERFVFIELQQAETIELGLAQAPLTGVMALARHPVESDSLIDLDTLKPKSFRWSRLPNPLCFRLSEQEDIYGAHNLTNGFARPCGQPNLWCSAGRGEPEHMFLRFEEEKTISEIVLTFDTDLDQWLWNIRPQEHSAMRGVVRDYTITCVDAAGGTHLIKVQGNYHRVNRHRFAPRPVRTIRIDFERAYETSAIGVYAVDIYA